MADQTFYVDDVCLVQGDFSDNMHPTLYSGDVYVQCSHEGGDFNGVYTSPIFDIGSALLKLVYILADIIIVGAGGNWEDVLLTALTTWEAVSVERKWGEIFEFQAIPTVKIRLIYGTSSPPTTEVERMEILMNMQTLQYAQIEIEITDPSDAIKALVGSADDGDEIFVIKYCS